MTAPIDKELLLRAQQEKIEFYNSRSTKFLKEAEALKEKHFRYSVARLIIFVLGIAGAILVWSNGALFSIIVILIAIAGFLFCLFTQFKLEKQSKHLLSLSKINSNEVSVLKSQENLYYDGSQYEEANHNYTLDLDIFGPFSMYKILNRARTYRGLRNLKDWLTQKPSLSQIQDRHGAIEELETDYKFRQEIAALLFEVTDQIDQDPAELIQKGFETDFSFASQSWLRIYRLIVPALWVLGGLLYFYHEGYGYLTLAILGLLNFGISLRYASKVNLIQNNISKSLRGLSRYGEVLSHIQNREWKSAYIQKLVIDNSDSHSQSKVKALHQLSHLIDLLDYRLHMIPSFLLNIGLLWDSRLIDKIGIWKSEHPELVSEVFEIIGTVESISSLSTWAFNHEHYSYARVIDSDFNYNGKSLSRLLRVPICQARVPCYAH